MKAWRVYGLNDMRLDEISIPQAKPGWLLAKVKTFQPSITEIQRLWGKSQRGLDTMHNIIQTTGPYCFGHEVSAVVEDIVDDCDIKKGDRITYYHKEGMICGFTYSGCFAEYYLLPISAAHKVDPAITDVQAPALQPFSSCIRAVNEAGVGLGDRVAIFGQGVMGLNITQLCHLAGASLVIGLDVREKCLKVSQRLGADITIDSTRQDPVKTIKEITNGKGVDVAFECASGSPEVGLSGGKTLFEAIEAVAKHGKLVQIAFFHENTNIDLNVLRTKKIKYIFPDEPSRKEMETGVNLVARGRIKFDPYITHVLQGIEELPQSIDITAYKPKHDSINPAVVVVS